MSLYKKNSVSSILSISLSQVVGDLTTKFNDQINSFRWYLIKSVSKYFQCSSYITVKTNYKMVSNEIVGFLERYAI